MHSGVHIQFLPAGSYRLMSARSVAAELTVVSFSETQSGHSQDILTLVEMLNRLGVTSERFVLAADFHNVQALPERPVVLVMNASMAVKASHAIKAYRGSIIIISYSAWELPNPPVGLVEAPIDIVLAGSRFAEKSLGIARPDTIYLPLLVESRPLRFGRNVAIGGPFTFLSVLNLCSYSSRKNPWGVINAFSTAFAPQDFGVRLVLKISGSNCDPREYQKLLAAADQDRRIVINSRRLSDKAMHQIFDRCDAYVSLHRSEGFGRTIAEAMQNKKPVIATAWSGSMDLTEREVSFLCDFVLRPLADKEYVEFTGQTWAEPDTAHAARLMAHVAELSLSHRQKFGSAAAATIRKKFGYTVNAEAYENVFCSLR